VINGPNTSPFQNVGVMKVAIYCGTFYKDKDGVARTVYHLVESLLKEGHEVEVWTGEVSPETIPGIRINKFPSFPIPLYPAYRFAVPWFGLLRRLKNFDPDVVHNATPDLGGLIFLLYAKFRNLPSIAVYHTDFPAYLKYYKMSALKYPFLFYLRFFYNTADAVLAPTKEIIAKLERRKVRTIRLWSRGIDRGKFHPKFRNPDLRNRWDSVERVAVLFSGRFVWYKDIKVLMEVYDRIQAGTYRDKVRFILQGHGPEEDILKRHMPEAHFSGYLTGNDLSEGYASADIFLFPSKTETFGNVVQEAISSGLPALVSDWGGCQEIVKDSGCGLISKAGDAEEFHRNLIKLIEDRGLREDMIRKGQEYASERSWEKINRDLFEYYHALSTSKKGG